MKEIGTFKIDKNMCSNCREDGNCPQEYSVIGNCLHIEKGLVIEQVSETWEELKNLCNENNLEVLADIIYTNALSFHKNGDIKDNENSIVAVNRTPQQMWGIIKNLIGEE